MDDQGDALSAALASSTRDLVARCYSALAGALRPLRATATQTTANERVAGGYVSQPDVAREVLAATNQSSLMATVTSEYEHKSLDYVFDRLLAIGERLVADETSAGSTGPIIYRAWTEAQLFLQPRIPAPSVVPSEDGGIAFVWHRAGWDLEVEIDGAEATAWATSRNTGESWFGPLYARRADLNRVLREMVAN